MAQPPIVDTKLPLSWVIGCAAVIVFAMGANLYKLDVLTASINKIESRSDKTVDTIGAHSQSIVLQQAQNDRNTSDIATLKRDVDELKTKRWIK